LAALPVQITWGHRSAKAHPVVLRLAGQGLTISGLRLERGDASDELVNGVVRSWAGGGDVDGLSCLLHFEPRAVQAVQQVHPIWEHLLTHGETGASRRLRADGSFRPDPRRLTITLDDEGATGFSLTVDQLLNERNLWLPELDVFVSTEASATLESHKRMLKARNAQRVLDCVQCEPEATYASFSSRWEDMGRPDYRNPRSVPPGHIICLGWNGGLYKFGVDRNAGVRNDYGRQDSFILQFGRADADRSWRGQKLEGGLPIVTTTFEEAGVRQEIEQFVVPLHGPSTPTRGDSAMVLMQRISLTELRGEARKASVKLDLERDGVETLEMRAEKKAFLFEASADPATCLAIQGKGIQVESVSRAGKTWITAVCDLPAHGAREFFVKLPSPRLSSSENQLLLSLDHAQTRARTLKFWEDDLARGARFTVPEEPVNALFRANLWHARRLPRRHGDDGVSGKLDLPYSNFAYDQSGAPWPVNQAVYVDYMIYDLRGYPAAASEELAMMFASNQEPDGHVAGFENWGVYTPAMLYAVGQHYLLSGDRGSFEKLLPAALRALNWCLGELRRVPQGKAALEGLVPAALNDLSHQSAYWAFNQAYFIAGLEILGRALADLKHPRAGECLKAAGGVRAAMNREFARASVRSPAVQLADGTWVPYVPTDAQGAGRLFKTWYPTDVDTGPLHASRLGALDPRGLLTTAMLNDHEDNLFFNQWGMANEPVYNPQAAVYLLRDEPKPTIRAFYSMMACAFSHTVFEPVEQRWGWPQYFGPPSTDGAWFELYRNMLLRERDDDALLLCQATPRAWLRNGQRIEVQNAPTYFGTVSFAVQSKVAEGEISATIDLSLRKPPQALFVRFRHPETRAIRSVVTNGEAWADFDVRREWCGSTGQLGPVT
jgi:hypothetical protein